MFYVKFYKKDYLYIYLINGKNKIKFLTFSSFLSFIEENKIDFKKVKFNMNLDDLFYHFVDYNSVKRVISYSTFEDKKKELLK